MKELIPKDEYGVFADTHNVARVDSLYEAKFFEKELMNKPVFNAVFLSGGKDSTAMLLMMIERKMPIDLILFCDTGLEFPQMYEHINKLEKDIGIPITRVKAEKTFEYYLLRKPRTKKFENQCGYDWPDAKTRWCTTSLKIAPHTKFLKPFKEKYNVIEYAGIAADEKYRLERKCNMKENRRHPLVDWNMTESECLKYCYDKGYEWGGLYEIFKRVSCWCCPLQTLAELRELREHFPYLWKQLKEWDSHTYRDFREGYSVKYLETRFDFEKECIRQGKSITNRAFYKELKNKLKGGAAD